jgi:polyisoprenoid-binding protein YceI
MKQRLFLSLLVSIFFFIQVSTFAATWEIDPAHSNFQFKIRHLTASTVTLFRFAGGESLAPSSL